MEFEEFAESVRASASKAEKELNKLLEAFEKLRKQELSEWSKREFDAIKHMAGSREDNTDFQAMLNAIDDFRDAALEKYREYPAELEKLLADLAKMEESAATDRKDKLLHIEEDKTNGAIAEYGNLIAYYKNMRGLEIDGKAFEFGAADEAGYVRLQMEENQKLVDYLKNSGRELTNEEASELEKRLKARSDYENRLEILSVNALKEEQARDKEAAKEAARAAEDAGKEKIEAYKRANKELSDEVKARYKAEADAAKAAADAEIRAIDEKIAAIDALLEGDKRGYADEDYFDKRNRLSETLRYETDGANKYELNKELDNLAKEYEKRKRREGLEDERAALREEKSAVSASLSERTTALAELRDSELASLQAEMAAYLSSLEIKTSENIRVEETITVKRLDELKKRGDNQAKANKELSAGAKALGDELSAISKKAANDGEAAFSNFFERIIAMARATVRDFAAIGEEAGAIFAGGFHAAAELIMAETAAGASKSDDKAGAASLNISQNFYTETASPADIARAGQKTAEMLARIV